MKEIRLSDSCVERIESIRDYKIGTYEGELEGILEVLSGLNDLIVYAKDSKEVAQFVNDAHRAIDKVLDYYQLLKLIVYESDIHEDGEVTVNVSEDFQNVG